ncbi:MAG: DUF3604 domain-containing protein [Planctomycetota bacterium]|jgi:hypothetical protein
MEALVERPLASPDRGGSRRARSGCPRAFVCLAAVCLITFGCDDGAADRGASPDADATDSGRSDGGVGDSDAGASEGRVDAGLGAEGRCREFTPTRRPLFGDLHVHTTLSLDANVQGTRLRPADAYRFALGDRVGIQPHDADGQPQRSWQIDRPLDFAAVTDHAEFLGTVESCLTPGSAAYDHPQCVGYRDNPDGAFFTINALTARPQSQAAWPALCGEAGEACEVLHRAAWRETVEAAEAANDESDACGFSAFVGFEWSGGPATANLHRNVIFANGDVPPRPVSYFDAPYPVQLWAALRAECLEGSATGGDCDVLAIPHNSNLGTGEMFGGDTASPDGWTTAAAEEAAAMEPLFEVMQHKGASECRLDALGDDECGFELLPYNSLTSANLDIDNEPEARDFVRWALTEGLRLAETWGVDPFRYGLIGSTDTHTATPGAVMEWDFKGHGGAGQNNREQVPQGLPDHQANNPGGLAVVWAEENSREAIFAALRRRETYATSGPRIVLRVFGTWDAAGAEGLCGAVDPVGWADANGTPMGGALRRGDAGDGPPTFYVSALQDPGTEVDPGAPLARLEMVKGWLEDGEPRTRVYSIAESGGAATVDPATCRRTGDGAASLCAVWSDPEPPAGRAWYYVRALEVPSCRWTTRRCVAAGVDCAAPETVTEGYEGCCDARFAAVQRERAWSSPIWVDP